MQGIGQLDISEWILMPAAQMLRMGFYPLFFQPVADFGIADHHRAGAFGNFDRITDMVAMAMRDQDIIRFHFIFG